MIFWLSDYFCLTWPPRQTASCTGPSVGMSVWQLSALSEQSADTKPNNTQNQYGENRTQRQLSYADLPAEFSLLLFCEWEDLVYIRRLDVWLGAVRDAILQHFLYTGHQEDICMRVGHWEDTLQEEKGQSEEATKVLLLQSFSGGTIFCKENILPMFSYINICLEPVDEK